MRINESLGVEYICRDPEREEVVQASIGTIDDHLMRVKQLLDFADGEWRRYGVGDGRDDGMNKRGRTSRRV